MIGRSERRSSIVRLVRVGLLGAPAAPAGRGRETVRKPRKVLSGATFIFTFPDAMG